MNQSKFNSIPLVIVLLVILVIIVRVLTIPTTMALGINGWMYQLGSHEVPRLSIIGIIMFQLINLSIHVVFVLDPPHSLPHSFSTGESVGQRRKKYTIVLYSLLLRSHSYPSCLQMYISRVWGNYFSNSSYFFVCFRLDWVGLRSLFLSLVVSFFLFIPPFKSVPVSLQTRAMSDKNVGANGGKVSLPEYEVKVERDVEMKTRDGVTLVSDVYR